MLQKVQLVWPHGLLVQTEGDLGREEEEVNVQGQQVCALAK